MVHLSLVCLLHEMDIKYRTTRVSAAPTYDKIFDIVCHNICTLQQILDFCKNNKITSYRVPCDLIPLWSHPDYQSICDDIFEATRDMWKGINTHDIHLSCHPDQFILLNSLNQDVNERAIVTLNTWAKMCEVLPINLINIHIGGYQSSLDHHMSIISDNLPKLHNTVRQRLSFENDEKNYNAEDVLYICQQLDVMMVPDFHHERCWQKRATDVPTSIFIEQHMEDIFATYKNRQTIPTFHISSPKDGWNKSFKENCSHADYIDSADFPEYLLDIPETVILDVEAKHKQRSIFVLQAEFF